MLLSITQWVRSVAAALPAGGMRQAGWLARRGSALPYATMPEPAPAYPIESPRREAPAEAPLPSQDAALPATPVAPVPHIVAPWEGPEGAGGAAAQAIRGARSKAQLDAALRAAADLYPHQAWPLREAVSWAVAGRHWAQATALAANLRQAYPSDQDGYAQGARALRALGQHDAADAVSVQAGVRFTDAWPLTDLAMAAQARKAWSRAAAYATQLLDRFPAEPAGYIVGLHALRQLRRLNEAEALLAQARVAWPDQDWVHNEAAWLAHQRGDWAEALRRANDARVLFPQMQAGYRVGAFCLVQTRRYREAEQMLEEAAEKLGAPRWILPEYARIARLQANWPEARRRWAECRAAFPDQSEAYVEGAIALRAMAEFDAADQLLLPAMQQFPKDAALFEQYARVAQSRPDWVEADRRWTQARAAFPAHAHIALYHAEMPARGIFDGKRNWDEAFARFDALLQQFPGMPEAHAAYIGLLGEAKRYEAARARADEAAACFPASLEIALAQAQAAAQCGAAEEAEQRYQQICASFPASPAALLRLAALYARLDRAGAADAACARAMARFPNQPEVFREYAEVAMHRHDWALAHTRWVNAEQRFPSDRVIRKRLHQARLALAEAGDAFDAAVSGAHGAPAAPLAELIGHFESLGGSGQGCEFGLVQRALGAEPLGLLRWSQMTHAGLIAALDSEFAGVGTPEQTVLDYYEALTPNLKSGDDPEYVTADRRFLMRAHTFVRRGQIPFDKMHAQSCRRISFLKRKFIEELSGASKVFVFKLYERILSAEEIEALHAALCRYGANTLLYVRYETTQHSSGSVERVKDGLMIGYIDRFSVTKTGQARTPNLPAWTAICQETWRLHQLHAKAPANQATLS